MDQSQPLWRSMLFVPANVPRYVDKAHERGADAIILDLEDSVPAAEKAVARQQLAAAAQRVAASGADVVVRINASLRLATADLEAAIGPWVCAVCVPKVSGGAQLRWIGETIEELEIERQLPPGHTRLIALVESVEALAGLDDIATATPRLAAMILGSEDFSAAVGMQPDTEGLLYPNQQIVFAARAAGILPLGLVGSIAEYGDPDALRDTIRRSRRLGLRGGFCIHPSQVPIMNEAFAPSTQEVDQAGEVLKAYEQALRENRGSASYRGKMIDAPVVARAREVLACHRRILSAGGHGESGPAA